MLLINHLDKGVPRPINNSINVLIGLCTIVSLYTTQMTQAMSLPKAKPKIVFDIGCDHLAPSMAIIFFIHVLHFAKAYD